MAEPPVIFERDGDVACLRLNRPEARNSLRLDDIGRLAGLLEEVASSGARCLVLRGAGAAQHETARPRGRDLLEQPGEPPDVVQPQAVARLRAVEPEARDVAV